MKLVLEEGIEMNHESGVSNSGPRVGPYSVGPKTERVQFRSQDDALQWVTRFGCYMNRIVPTHGIEAMTVLPIQMNGIERTASMVKVTVHDLVCVESDVTNEDARQWLQEHGGNTVNEFPDVFSPAANAVDAVPAAGGSGQRKRGSKASAKWLPTGRTVVHKGVTRKVWVSARDATVMAVKRVVKSADGSRKARYNLLSRGEGASGARPLRP